MTYTVEEVFDYIEQEDVSFIRLAFCDIHGKQKNVSIMPNELRRAFEYGISFDATAIEGFSYDSDGKSDLLLFSHPVYSHRTSVETVSRQGCKDVLRHKIPRRKDF